MTLTISGFHQHVVSYYTLEDAVAGRLRRPSTIPEFASLEISPEYLNVANFRYPPSIELGADGVPRYHGEPDDRPVSPSRMPQYGAEMYDAYGGGGLDSHHQPRMRSVTVPTISTTNFSPTQSSYVHPSSGGYYDPQQQMHIPPAPRISGGPARPGHGSRRYDPYASTNPRVLHPGMPPQNVDSGHQRRLSQPPPPGEQNYYQPSEYNYQPPSTAPGAFTYYSPASAAPPQQQPLPSPVVSSPSYGSGGGPGQYAWHQPPAQGLRTLPIPGRPDMLDHPSSSSGSLDSAPGSSGAHVMPPDWANLPPANAAPVWDNHPPPQMSQQPYAVQQGDGWQAGLA